MCSGSEPRVRIRSWRLSSAGFGRLGSAPQSDHCRQPLPGQAFLGHFCSSGEHFALVRLQNNQKLSQAPVPKPEGSRGAPRKHGADFRLSAISRPTDASEEFFLGKQKVRVRAWHKLHFKRFASVVGTVVCVEFSERRWHTRYKHPIWLFWTGPEMVSLQDLCRMYLWRFAIEHLFRFLKQHMGLKQQSLTRPGEH